MKKMLTLLLAVLLVLGQSACRQNPSPSGESPAIESAAPSQAETPGASAVIDLKNLVLSDNDLFLLKVIDFVMDEALGCTLEVYLENKTGTPLTLSISDASVNNYMCSPYWSMELGAKAREDSKITWHNTDLDQNGISAIRAIEFTLCAASETEELFNDVFAIYPNGDTVEALASDPRQPVPEETLLVDNEDFYFSITEFGTETAFGYAFSVYLENRTDRNVLFTVDTATINGIECNPYWAAKLLEGKRTNTFLSWMDYALEERGITDVESIQFSLRVYDADEWLGPALYKGEFTVTP